MLCLWPKEEEEEEERTKELMLKLYVINYSVVLVPCTDHFWAVPFRTQREVLCRGRAVWPARRSKA